MVSTNSDQTEYEYDDLNFTKEDYKTMQEIKTSKSWRVFWGAMVLRSDGFEEQWFWGNLFFCILQH